MLVRGTELIPTALALRGRERWGRGDTGSQAAQGLRRLTAVPAGGPGGPAPRAWCPARARGSRGTDWPCAVRAPDRRPPCRGTPGSCRRASWWVRRPCSFAGLLCPGQPQTRSADSGELGGRIAGWVQALRREAGGDGGARNTEQRTRGWSWEAGKGAVWVWGARPLGNPPRASSPCTSPSGKTPPRSPPARWSRPSEGEAARPPHTGPSVTTLDTRVQECSWSRGGGSRCYGCSELASFWRKPSHKCIWEQY